MATAEEYRAKLLITHIRVNKRFDSWAVCPRCYSSIDREYMSFCTVCGQHLDWSGYHDAEFVYDIEKIGKDVREFISENEKPCHNAKWQGLFRRIISKLCGLN